MKKHFLYKTVQLIVTLLLAVGVIALVLTNPEVYHMAAQSGPVQMLCVALWLTLGASLVFLLLDFTYFLSYRKDYREMDYAIHSDPISGIANRFSCDMLVEKYLDKPLPKDIGCMMLELTNIRDINSRFGHIQGNHCISDFSAILSAAAKDLCFVGRNGGNKFLAVFENTTEEKMELFRTRVQERVENYNATAGARTLAYETGSAFHEGAQVIGITQMIALSDRRIHRQS